MIKEHRSGRPVEVSDLALKTRIAILIQEDPCFTVERITQVLQEMLAKFITLSVSFQIPNQIHYQLKYQKTNTRWVRES